jgi:hypothetical protein
MENYSLNAQLKLLLHARLWGAARPIAQEQKKALRIFIMCICFSLQETGWERREEPKRGELAHERNNN